MKYQWRVTKYNPQNRDEMGKYLVDEWSSISDIGTNYNGQVFSLLDYEKQEEAYIDSIFEFMKCAEVSSLTMVDIEDYNKQLNKVIDKKNIPELLSENQIRVVVKAILREKFWCKLELKDSFFVHFGYDYIMYIGLNNKCEETIRKVEQMKMFVESMESPYLLK